MKPVGGQRGTEVEVTLTGQRLADAKEILFYQPGITATKLEAADDGQVDGDLRRSPPTPRWGCTTSGSGRRPGSARCGPSASAR